MRARRDTARRWLATFVASVALHAVVLSWRCADPGSPEVPAVTHLAEAERIEVEIVTEAAPRPAPATPEPAPAPARPKQAKRRPSGPSVTAAPGHRDPPAAGGPDLPFAEPGAGSASPLVRVPSQRTADRITGGRATAERHESIGQTVVNGPGEEPDPEAVAEYTSEKLTRNLNEELQREAGSARVMNNTQPRYFSRVREQLGDELKSTPVELSANKDPTRSGISDALETWRQPAEQYGRTGSPFASPDQTRALEESSFGRMMQRDGHPARDETTSRELNGMMQSMAATGALVQSAQRPRLRAVVGMYQDWSGALADIRLIERSSDPKFDDFVIHISRKVLREHGERDHDAVDLPYRPEGWSSEWQFTWEPPDVKVRLLRVIPGPPGPPVR